MFPSFSGAYRIRIVFSDDTERHFYMMPNGGLFIPPNHKDAEMLLDIKRATKEWVWAVNDWPKGGTGARLVTRFNEDIYSKIMKLCEKFEIPNYYHRRLHEKLEKEANRPVLKNAFADEFKKIRRNINQEQKGGPVEVLQNTAQKPKAEKSSVSTGVEPKVNSGNQISKFMNKFGNKWRGTTKFGNQQQATD